MADAEHAPATPGNAEPDQVTDPSHDDPAHAGPITRIVAEMEQGRAGPYLYHGSAAGALALARRLADRLDVAHVAAHADTIGLAGDPVGDTTLLLRDAVFLRVRILKKVFEGRVRSVRRLGPDPGPAGVRTPPPKIEVTLATDSDQRAVQLEGGFATAFWQSGARVGDIVQIDTDQPLVVLRPDRAEAEGRVAEERDLVYRVRLGDVDRAGVPPEPPETEGRRAAPLAPLRLPLLGTGRSGVPTLEAMRQTDRWVGTQVGGKGTRIEVGVLALTDAETLPHTARIVLREATDAPAAPIVVLQTEDDAMLDAWARFFPQGVRLDRDTER